MTENEIREEIKELKRKASIFENSGYATVGISLSFKKAVKVIEFLLEEIQQYRAIGTVKEIKIREAQFERLSAGYLNDLSLLREYQEIGTVEEFKALKEKSVAKKPKIIGYRKDGEPVYECGCCGSTLKVADQPFCMICSCKVDWSE